MPSEEGRFADMPEEKSQDARALAKRLSWRYRHERAEEIPSKLTATQLKGRLLDMEAAEDALPTREEPRDEFPIRRPDFIANARGLTAAQRGMVLHQAIQYIPLDGDHSPRGIQNVIDQLVSDGYLTHLQGEALQPGALSVFFTSPLGRAMAAAPECQREFKFSLLVPAHMYFPDVDESEEILLQGVIDAWFGDANGVTVIDFKTDRIRKGGEAARAEEYRFQMETYSRALEKIIGRPVKHQVLWFFATGTGFEL